ncbi:NAD(P)/FAD-dependent oxidoreductase [Aeromonas caviae]|uniref:NAD(P)/FAD-dependent oxidoreductase n=1 Tax=Aeromonas caviae TaxID=648 RepID=UPI001F183DEE|nr:FAD-binding oxidoreductase [Aeromonas caviae]
MTEHVKSYYAASANKHTPYPTLTEQLECDVCVIGAGYTGLSSALHLVEKGYKVVVLEAARSALAPAAATAARSSTPTAATSTPSKRTARRIRPGCSAPCCLRGPDHPRADQTLQHPVICRRGRLCRRDREAAARAQGAEGALGEVGQRPAGAARCQGVREVVASDRYVGALLDKSGGHIHPLNLALGRRKPSACRGLIFEQSAVTSITPGQPALVKTAKGAVKARFIVVAGNAYLGNLVPELASKSMPCGTQVIATEVLGESGPVHSCHRTTVWRIATTCSTTTVPPAITGSSMAAAWSMGREIPRISSG